MINIGEKSHCNTYFGNSGFCAALNAATKTPEILGLQRRLENSVPSMEIGLSTFSGYLSDLASQWNWYGNRWIY